MLHKGLLTLEIELAISRLYTLTTYCKYHKYKHYLSTQHHQFIFIYIIVNMTDEKTNVWNMFLSHCETKSSLKINLSKMQNK